ncbi:MAG TPA: PQQ-dependent sugar dehydrogenase [Vicinamibacterales bacterium]|nr:PQQ-dependent sugar dehydrogenase [Vicinamibacterales bacterium]
MFPHRLRHRLARLAAAASVCLLAGACENRQPPAPAPAPGTAETITGRERIGWEQPAGDSAELGTFRYAIYVDGTRFELTETACSPSRGSTGFPCSARLPAMSPGSHVLELAAFVLEGSGVVESAKSAPLRVTVVGATAPAAADPLQDGDAVVTADGARLTARLVAEDLHEPSDIAVAPDGRLFIAERGGRVRVQSGGGLTTGLVLPEVAPPGGLFGITLAPDFARTRTVFLAHTAAADGSMTLRIARYREFEGHLLDRLVLLPDIPVGPEPAAALRFGPDGKLYVAVGDGGDADAAARLADFTGKVLRLEPDGRTPRDQPAASPVYWHPVRAPRALAWTAGGGTMWMVEEAGGMERIRALRGPAEDASRGGQRAAYVLPRPLGAAAAAAYGSTALPHFEGDLFIAARAAGYLLRVRFDPEDPTRAVSSERLLENRLGPVHAVAVGPDGALYVCAGERLWKLAAAR